MKAVKPIIRAVGLVLLMAFSQNPSLHAAVTFTNTPSAVSNTFTGVITFQITGLSTGDTVIIRKYIDGNTNGIVDPTDPLIQQFQLTDGQGPPVFSGVTNLNVPGDLNPTNGSITAQVNFPGGDFTAYYVAKYFYVLSSPAGHFTPITNSFTVTNLPFAQTLSGNVVSNGTGTTIPYAVVFLFPPPPPNNGPGNPLAGAVANSAGNYSIKLPPGTYVPMAFASNYVGDYTTSPVITLTNGQSVSTNLTLSNATAVISGRLVDAATNSLGLAGTFLPVSLKGTNVTNTVIAGGFTDTNGNFSFGVTSGQWQLDNARGLLVDGYVEYNNGTNVNSGTSNLVVAIPKASAIFYGSVKDNLGNPLPGIAVAASDNNVYYTDGFTDTNGNYVAGAVGGLTNDSWHPEIDNNPTNYVFSQSPLQQNGGTNLSIGQAVQQNFTAYAVNNRITGKVKDNNGNPIVGVGVRAYATNAGLQFNATSTVTDSNGNYTLFVVSNADWNVYLNCGCSNCSDGLSASYQCPDNQTTNLGASNGVVNFTVEPVNEYQLFGFVRNNQSAPIAGVTVYADGNSSLSTNTDTNGYYSFSVPDGNWDVSVDCAGLNNLGYQCVGDQDVNITGNPLEVNFTVQTNTASLSISTTTLSNATQNAFYTTRLDAAGGSPPYTWALAEGSASLPLGITLKTNGVISGTTASSGTFPFIVFVTDTLDSTSYQILSLTVNSSALPPVIVLTSPSHSGTNQFQFTFNTASGVSYVIQYSADLRNWTSLVSFDGSGGPVTIIDPNAPGTGARFYRVKLGP